MKGSTKAVGVSIVVVLILGFLGGFIPEHMRSAKLSAETAVLDQKIAGAQAVLQQTQNALTLSNFAVGAAVLYSTAEKNNYSEASTEASSLFTALRNYTDSAQDQIVKAKLTQVLNERDTTIAALAKADPAVKAKLRQIFVDLAGVAGSMTVKV
ncbi:MAG: hypothetical protein ABI064_06595 [Acidobacteriaceae bacterium]